MANHCIEVICAGCGAQYCPRCEHHTMVKLTPARKVELTRDTTMRYTIKCRYCFKRSLYPYYNLQPIPKGKISLMGS